MDQKQDTATKSLKWISNQKACAFFCSMLSLFYALVLIIGAVIVEISPTWSTRLHQAELIFYVWMYGVGLLIFAYFYLIFIHIEWLSFAQRLLMRLNLLAEESLELTACSHSNIAASSLYLRFGALAFGSFGIVLLCSEIVTTLDEDVYQCAKTSAKYILTCLFVFVQMHFIFTNSKIIIDRSKIFCYFGLMHIVAVNVFSAIRYSLVEAIHYHTKHKSLPNISKDQPAQLLGLQLLVDIHLGAQTSTIFVTCLVEYFLIGSGMMFVLWLEIGGKSIQSRQIPVNHRRNSMIADCSRSTTGLFGGILYMCLAVVAIAINIILEHHVPINHDPDEEPIAFYWLGTAQLLLYLWILVIIFYGLWRMRNLQYRADPRRKSGEILDRILLVIGVFGEILFCFIAIDLWLENKKTDDGWSRFQPIYFLFVYILRLSSALSQAMFILLSGRLIARNENEQKVKSGKQSITFLLVANISLFIFTMYESMRSNLPIELSSLAYPYLIYGISPFTVFYRFHSAVCLLEIYRKTYNTKFYETLQMRAFSVDLVDDPIEEL
ncbi:unnamed protein product, partial [Mesorhabditis belari]|uniref:Uncharacterized protein n=1 Tax=Mesorhabditis belari TaxID=2138241 RepID=A0AAF3FKI3_9BILA